MKKQILYGMLGFLSLLGFAGVFTEARGFLGFFAFAVDFQYFFLKSDEMLEAQLARSASRAFVVGMLMMAAAVLGTLTLGGFTPQRAQRAKTETARRPSGWRRWSAGWRRLFPG